MMTLVAESVTIGHCGGAFNEAPSAGLISLGHPIQLCGYPGATSAVCSSGETGFPDVRGIETAEKRSIDNQNIQRLVRCFGIEVVAGSASEGTPQVLSPRLTLLPSRLPGH